MEESVLYKNVLIFDVEEQICPPNANKSKQKLFNLIYDDANEANGDKDGKEI